MYFRRNKFKFKFNKSVADLSSSSGGGVSDNVVNLKIIMKIKAYNVEVINQCYGCIMQL
jgi:hypothetical protein